MGHSAPEPRASFRLGDRQIDLERRVVTVVGTTTPVRLTALESTLLAYLADQFPRTVGQAELLEQVWGYAEGVRSSAPYHTVTRLRRKIEDEPDAPIHLVSVYGKGYRLELPSSPHAPDVPRELAPSPLLGRATATREVSEHLRDARAVAIVGFPGVGKTRLAIELARSLASGFPGGVWYLVRERARNADTVRRRIADGTGPRLVVLDDVDAAWVGHGWEDLAREAPDARWLLTLRSLEPLSSAPVLPYHLGPVDVPTAAQLYRSHAHSHGVDVPDSEDLTELMKAVDGVPAAVVSLAERCRLHTPGDQLSRIRADPTAHPQHAEVDQLWRDLPTDLSQALASCCVFQGWFTVETARAVVGGSTDLEWALEGLLDRCLLLRDGRHVRVPSIVRRTGVARLAAGRHTELQAQHLDHHAAWWTLERPIQAYIRAGDDLLAAARFAQRRAPLTALRVSLAALEAAERVGPRASATASSEVIDVDQLPDSDRAWGWIAIARLRRLRGHGDPVGALERATELAADADARAAAHEWLGTVLREAGHPAEAEAAHRAAVQQPASDARRARAARACAETLGDVGQFPDAIEMAGRALRIYEQRDDQLGIAECLSLRGTLRARCGQVPEARTDLGHARRLAAPEGHALVVDTTDHAWAIVARAGGNHDEALRILEGGLERATRRRDRRATAIWLAELGLQLRTVGRMTEAEDRLTRAIELHAEVGNRRGQAIAQTQLGTLLSRRGRDDEAIGSLEAALALHRAVRNRRFEAWTLHSLGHVQWGLGELAGAEALLRSALDHYEALGLRHDVMGTAKDLGDLALDRGASDEALDWLRRAHALTIDVGLPSPGVESLLAMALAEHGQVVEARMRSDRALAALRELGLPMWLAMGLCRDGHVWWAVGDPQAAATALSAAEDQLVLAASGLEKRLMRTFDRLRARLAQSPTGRP